MYSRERKLKFIEYVRDLISEQVDVDGKEPYASYKKELLRQFDVKIARLEKAIQTYKTLQGRAHGKEEAANPDS